MSERYSKLFALSENLYASGSPVVIAAGALLKDNQTGNVIAQLKLRNIHTKPIKAAMVCITPLDTVGKPIGDAVYYQYLDLQEARDAKFGQKTAISLPDPATRSFSVSVEEVAFIDNTVWTTIGEPWEMLPTPQPIGQIHGKELEKQFRIKYGNNCKNLLLTERDLWFCVCGALNHSSEEDCHACHKVYSTLSSIDYDELNREKDARLSEEKAAAEQKAEETRAKIEALKTKAKKIKKIATIAIPILVFIAIAAVIISGIINKNNAYNDALALMNAEQYSEAIKKFSELGDYKDCAEQIKTAETELARIEAELAYAKLESAYTKALGFLEAGKYEEAYTTFKELGDFKDASAYLEEFIPMPIQIKGSWATTSISYDESGRPVLEITKGKTDDINNREKKYTYNADGSIKIVEKYALGRYDGKDYFATETTVFSADRTESTHTIKSDTYTKKYTRKYTYDNYGNILTVKSVETDTNKVEYNRKYVYTYDASGNPLTSYFMEKDKKGQWSGKWDACSYVYDENGNIASIEYSNGGIDKYIYAMIYCPKK